MPTGPALAPITVTVHEEEDIGSGLTITRPLRNVKITISNASFSATTTTNNAGVATVAAPISTDKYSIKVEKANYSLAEEKLTVSGSRESFFAIPKKYPNLCTLIVTTKDIDTDVILQNGSLKVINPANWDTYYIVSYFDTATNALTYVAFLNVPIDYSQLTITITVPGYWGISFNAPTNSNAIQNKTVKLKKKS